MGLEDNFCQPVSSSPVAVQVARTLTATPAYISILIVLRISHCSPRPRTVPPGTWQTSHAWDNRPYASVHRGKRAATSTPSYRRTAKRLSSTPTNPACCSAICCAIENSGNAIANREMPSRAVDGTVDAQRAVSLLQNAPPLGTALARDPQSQKMEKYP